MNEPLSEGLSLGLSWRRLLVWSVPGAGRGQGTTPTDSAEAVPETGFPGGASGEEPTCPCRRHKRRGFDPWKEGMATTLVFLPGESHGQRSLEGPSP